ncbi:hypothetical protein TWF506_002525 [Arthrobotrys conoides]|uniref:Protein kinase domain-containing protein n=1 Tax=Arthrobotrys conoides TaxID=74498 RepID=A0AAN8N980_9PEZI
MATTTAPKPRTRTRRPPLPTLEQVYVPKPGDISLALVREQFKLESSQVVELGPQVYKMGPYVVVKLERRASPVYHGMEVAATPEPNANDTDANDSKEVDDNFTRPPVENIAREGELLRRAEPYAVKLFGRVVGLNEESGKLCCAGLILQCGKPLDEVLDTFTESYPPMAEKNRLATKMMILILKLHKEKRMVHGDIKPQNMVLVNGEVKLIDFESAKYLEEDFDDDQWEEWYSKGTPMYETPDRHLWTHEYESPVVEIDDLYAMALTMYQVYVPGQPFDFEASGGMFGPNPILEKRGFPDLSKVGSAGIRAWMKKVFVKGGGKVQVDKFGNEVQD